MTFSEWIATYNAQVDNPGDLLPGYYPLPDELALRSWLTQCCYMAGRAAVARAANITAAELSNSLHSLISGIGLVLSNCGCW